MKSTWLQTAIKYFNEFFINPGYYISFASLNMHTLFD
jgi:hypothetical protein